MFQTMTQPLLTPLWLQAVQNTDEWPADLPKISQAEIARIRHQDQLDTFEAIFDQAVDAVENGEGISLFLSRDHRSITPGRFMRWILADPARERRYKDACRVAAHLMRGDILAKADGTDQTIDDVARSKLAVDARFKLMALADPKEFITTTKVDVTGHQSISLVGLMKDRERQGMAMVERLNNLLPPADAVIKADNPYPVVPTDTPSDDEDDT